MTYEVLVLSAIVFVAFSIHAVTGFASMITALLFGSFFFPLEEIRPPLVLLSLVLNFYFVVGSRRYVAWRLLARVVLPWMILGVFAGFAMSGFVEGPLLCRAFGVFVIGVSVSELIRHFREHGPEVSGEIHRGWTVVAGVIHGIYATGGPVLVYGLAPVRLDKATLRASLCVVWAILNLGLTVGFVVRGDLTEPDLRLSARLLPACVAAIFVGSWLHDRLDARQFRAGVLFVLLFSAIGLVIR